MFVAKTDLISTLEDTEWTRDSIGKPSVIHYQEIDGGHASFLIGKNMTFFSEDVMNIID